MLYSARLDETGADGRSKFFLIGGAIAQPQSWAAFEPDWAGLLSKYKINAYHWKDFNDPRNKLFGGWSRLRRERFVAAQKKLIEKHTIFRVAVGIDRDMHGEVKRKMRGVKGFHAESDYGLCLRWLMFACCEELSKLDPESRLSILAEDGPWTKGAAHTFQRVAAMTAEWKPAKHAHRLVDFRAAPKGCPSLEAADFIAGSELRRLVARRKRKNRDTLSVLLTRERLQEWYEGMLEEKEARRSYDRGRRTPNAPRPRSARLSPPP